jgi:hypothetical protein
VPDDLHAIRCGIAAQLRTVLGTDEGHVSPYMLDAPLLPCLQVGTIEAAERMGFGTDGGSRYILLIEGLFSLEAEVAAQKALDELVAAQSIDAAIDADPTLTSRLDEHNTLTTSQGAACDKAAVSEYRGAARVNLPNGARALQGVWAILVVT